MTDTTALSEKHLRIIHNALRAILVLDDIGSTNSAMVIDATDTYDDVLETIRVIDNMDGD